MNSENIFGCFFKVCFDPKSSEQEFAGLANIFRDYLWGEKGIGNIIRELEHKNYGKDLELVLFEFYINPQSAEGYKIKEIGSYRRKEKSIGIPIIVNDENFFEQNEEGRRSFLKQSIIQKIDVLSEIVKKKKLDTKIDLLRADLKNLFG